ncbi:MAG TPA: ABC transporter permease [Thermotogota bacterium]|nr:ABC transporter permease [Thermotogota bacterium]HRW34489.1 ABC transporter permease [Thermotogota bacterium]
MKNTFGILKALIKSRIRDKEALFWTLAFPLMFLIIFGLAFGGSSTSYTNVEEENMRFAIFLSDSVSDQSQTHIIETSEILGLKPLLVYSISDLKESVEKGYDGVEFGISLDHINDIWEVHACYNAADMSKMQLYQSIVNNFVTEFQKTSAGFDNIIQVKTVNRAFTAEPVTNTGYILSGVIAVSISLSGLTALIISFGYYRKQNIIKRLIATPLKGSQFLTADIINNLLVSIVTIIIIMLFARLLFQVTFNINFWYLSITYFSSMFLMMSLGGFFLLIFKEPNAAMNLANIFSTVMMFFAGVYFPLELMPKWLQRFGHILPMTYVAENLRFALGQDYMQTSRFWTTNIIFIVIAAIAIPLMGKQIFKLEQS